MCQTDRPNYFNWLMDQAGLLNRNMPYIGLGEILYEYQFTYVIPRDANRAMDGMSLRDEFCEEFSVYDYFGYSDFYMDCNLLEMLVAFSRRMDAILQPADIRTDRSRDCMWVMLANLGLTRFDDDIFGESFAKNVMAKQEIQKILDRFVQRRYDYNGIGGLFPMKNAPRDQRKTEIWYQFNDYLLEKGDIFHERKV